MLSLVALQLIARRKLVAAKISDNDDWSIKFSLTANSKIEVKAFVILRRVVVHL